MMRSITGAFVVLVLVLVLGGCAEEAVDRSGTASGEEAATTTTTPATVEETTTTTTEPTTTTTTPIIESGMYVVPDDFAPGVYRVEGYWARLDAAQEITDNDLTHDGLSLMNVAPTDAYVEINGAATALINAPSVDPIAEEFTDGTYIVGPDIPPGRYNVTSAGRSAYAARLDTNREIIDNNLSEGNVIVQAQEGEWLSYTGNLEAMP